VRTAIDTSVLVDILIDDEKYGSSSRSAIERASEQGSIIICEAVVAELGPLLSEAETCSFLDDLGIGFVPISLEAATRAGAMFGRYFGRSSKKGRVIDDFLIGAHAQTHAEQLLTRDRGFYRDYFSGLKIL
jgi:predicted nucleic acid-binding protein